ncbi:putative reverse transcriptase domain-containing protein [Tanacetum coccineum]
MMIGMRIVNVEDIEVRCEIEVDDCGELIFPSEVEVSDSVSSDSVVEDRRGMYEVGESSAARDSSYVGGLEPWALRHDLEATRTRARLIEPSNVVERLKILESEENATLKKKLDETETRLAWARMEHDTTERSLHESIGWNKGFYWEMVLKGAVPKPPSDDEDDGRPRKKSKKLDRDDGPSEPRGPPSDSYLVGARSWRVEPVGDGAGVLERWEKDKVKFATATLQGRALTWWNGRTASMGIDAANGTPWAEVRKWMTEEMVEPEQVKVEQYIRGLSKNIRGDVTSSQPATIDHVVHMAYQLMGQLIQDKLAEVHVGEKRKGKVIGCGRWFVRNARTRSIMGIAGSAVSVGTLGPQDCVVRCPDKKDVTCFNCNKKGHLKRDCPTLRRNGQDGNNRRAVYKLGAMDAQEDPKRRYGTFT